MDVKITVTPDDIENRKFSIVRKGLSPDEVRRFLSDIAAAQRQQDIAPQFTRVGDEVAHVLESAHRSAAAIEAAASAEAEHIRAGADAYAAEVRANADREASERLTTSERAKAEAEAHVAALRSNTDRDAAADREAAARARVAAESFAETETQRLTQLRAEVDTHVSTARAALDAEHAECRAQLEAELGTHRDVATAQSTQLVADAEAKAQQILATAQAQADADVSAAEEDARLRSGAVIAHAQTRLDKLLAAERDVHDRLVAASADLKVAISRVAGRQETELGLTTADPLVDPSDVAPSSNDEPAPRARLEVVDQRSARSEVTPIATAAEGSPDRATGRSTERDDALTKMVNEAVGNALKGLKP